MTTSCCSQPSLSALLNVNKANLTIWQRNTDVWKGIRTPTCSAGRAGVRGWVQVKSSVKRAFDTLVDSAVFQRISWEFVVFSFGLSMRRRVNLAWEQQSQTRKEHVCWLIRNCITEVLWHLERPGNHYIHESPVQMQGVCEPRTFAKHRLANTQCVRAEQRTANTQPNYPISVIAHQLHTAEQIDNSETKSHQSVRSDSENF